MSASTDLYFSDKGFLFDPSTGLTYSLNKTGTFIFQRLHKGAGVPEVVQALLEAFEVDSKRAREDVRDFMQHLTELGLI